MRSTSFAVAHSDASQRCCFAPVTADVRCKRFAQNHECCLAAYRAEAGKIVVDFWCRVGRLMAANVSGHIHSGFAKQNTKHQ